MILGVSILLGLILLGFFIFKGLKTFSDKDRVVTVKGLAEMNLKATSATVRLKFSFSGDILQDVINKTNNKKNEVIAYLKSTGKTDQDIKVENIMVTDREDYYEMEWRNGQEVKVKIDRYTVVQVITIETKDVEKMKDNASMMELDLISKDLTCTISTEYVFPELNTIKPQLIAESTKNARIAGEQFANDSKAKLGKIKTASQGQISIAGNYSYDEEDVAQPEEPYLQKARVVSTIVFFLE
ncbi:MAG: hypothetical protein H6Q25_192 [Bacteroidetes bacterium]|nr:hypothetical protein [Bacteroidota bacterium]